MRENRVTLGTLYIQIYQAHKKRYLMSLKCPEAPKKSKFLLIISIRTTIIRVSFGPGKIGREKSVESEPS